MEPYPAIIWQPNNKFKSISIQEVSEGAKITIISIFQDERVIKGACEEKFISFHLVPKLTRSVGTRWGKRGNEMQNEMEKYWSAKLGLLKYKTSLALQFYYRNGNGRFESFKRFNRPGRRNLSPHPTTWLDPCL